MLVRLKKRVPTGLTSRNRLHCLAALIVRLVLRFVTFITSAPRKRDPSEKKVKRRQRPNPLSWSGFTGLHRPVRVRV